MSKTTLDKIDLVDKLGSTTNLYQELLDRFKQLDNPQVDLGGGQIIKLRRLTGPRDWMDVNYRAGLAATKKVGVDSPHVLDWQLIFIMQDVITNLEPQQIENLAFQAPLFFHQLVEGVTRAYGSHDQRPAIEQEKKD